MSTSTSERLEQYDTTTPDPGWFGPGSVSWRLHHDPSVLVGGIRALLLQSLHPQVMRRFHDSTSMRADPWGRLGRTADYVNVVVYGTHDEATAASERVRRVHHALGLDRPEWLLWVHCGAVDSWLTAFRQSGAEVTAGDADAYVAEQVVAARLVGAPTRDTPRSVAELREYFATVRPTLAAVPETRTAVLATLWPPMDTKIALLTPARPVWTAAALTALGLLPGWARRMLSPPGLPPVDLPFASTRARLSATAIRAALLSIPEPRRTSPHLRAARRRLGLEPAEAA